MLRRRLQGQALLSSQLQASKEAASILRPWFTGLYNGNIHTTLPGALCLLLREEGHLDLPQGNGTIYDFMDTDSKMLRERLDVRALGVAWSLALILGSLPWREMAIGILGSSL